jgi:hypothetical protein
MIVMFWILSCSKLPDFADNHQHSKLREVVLAWNNLYLELDRHTEAYYPPISARSFAYISLAAFEAINSTENRHNNLDVLLKGLAVPKCDPNCNLDPSIVLNSAYASSFRLFFSTTPQEYLNKINELEDKLLISNSADFKQDVVLNSKKYGDSISKAVYFWSSEDRVGHEAFNSVFDTNYTLSGRRDPWSFTTNSAKQSILPNWGKVRSFLVTVNDIAVKPPVLYSEDPASKMYKEALAIYSMSRPLSHDNAWIAEFWSDDHRGITFSPPARWVSIANQLSEKSEIPPAKLVELYLTLGMALCDASIICWEAKYKYAHERPQAYINRVIDKNWKPFHENPNFPSYPSGHAIFGAASSIVLTKYFGENYRFTDNSHINRKEFNGMPRSFNSFREMAMENAFSRNAMGVHSRNDCEEGLRLGFEIGRRITKLQITNDDLVLNESVK